MSMGAPAPYALHGATIVDFAPGHSVVQVLRKAGGPAVRHGLALGDSSDAACPRSGVEKSRSRMVESSSATVFAVGHRGAGSLPLSLGARKFAAFAKNAALA
jgi:hypothetical protein